MTLVGKELIISHTGDKLFHPTGLTTLNPLSSADNLCKQDVGPDLDPNSLTI